MMGRSSDEGALSVLDDVIETSLEDTVIISRSEGRDSSFGLPLDELRRRVIDYRIRVDEDSAVSVYSANDVGCYKIISAMDLNGKRSILPGIVRGRFVDAVAYAVKQNGFYADLGLGVDSRSSNNGYLVRVGYDEESVVVVDIIDGL